MSASGKTIIRTPIIRGYVTVGDRQVHYRRAGDGPPVVLLHQSPKSSAELTPHLRHLARRFTAVAIDRPGYGGSDPLGPGAPSVEGYVDALCDTLDALGIGPCPVYGSRTGAIEALAMTRRHPGRFTAVVIDGLPIMDDAMIERVRRESVDLVPRPDGGHLAWAWWRIRDRFLFFPWYDARLAARQDFDMASAEALHDLTMDVLCAGEWYASGPKAALSYRYLPDVEALDVPAAFICREDDHLYGHLDRLPPLPEGCWIERLPADDQLWLGRIESLLAGWSGQQPAPAAPKRFPNQTPKKPGAAGRVTRRYIDTNAGQLLVRRCGDDAGGGVPLLVVHDAAASSAQQEDLMTNLGAGRDVIAPDLPGCGDSDRGGPLTMDGYVEALLAVADSLGIGPFDLYGVGAGAHVAAALAARAVDRVRRLVLRGALILDSDRRAGLGGDFGAPIALRQDGAHLMTVWSMVRDMELFWPWYDRTRRAIRWSEPALDPNRLQTRLLDVLKQPDTWHCLGLAAYGFPLADVLPAVKAPTLVCAAPDDIGHSALEDVAALVAGAVPQDLPADAAGASACIAEFLDRT
ncbi:MAG: alpha/beta hydrolase [Proteobacteria bacterium]|nr:alpha/beta hydrolase [Pseudomonadota bacterium]